MLTKLRAKLVHVKQFFGSYLSGVRLLRDEMRLALRLAWRVYGQGRRRSREEKLAMQQSLADVAKVVPLAGLRVAYLAGDVEPLRRYIPPWPVSLPAQLAATVALGEPDYYRARRDEVRAEREVMRARLIDVLEAPYGVKVLPGCANFFLLELPKDFVVDAPKLVDGCRGRSGVYLRPFGAAWVRIAVRSRAENERVVAAIVAEVEARGGGRRDGEQGVVPGRRAARHGRV